MVQKCSQKTLKRKQKRTQQRSLSSSLVPCASAAARWLFPPVRLHLRLLRGCSIPADWEEKNLRPREEQTSLKMVLTKANSYSTQEALHIAGNKRNQSTGKTARTGCKRPCTQTITRTMVYTRTIVGTPKDSKRLSFASSAEAKRRSANRGVLTRTFFSRKTKRKWND